MSAFSIGLVVFICLCGASAVGMLLRMYLPDHHLSADSKDVIKLATAVVGTLSALALGLLIASAKNTYDRAQTELQTSAAHLILLDRVLAHYGPPAHDARGLLRKLIEDRLRQPWDKKRPVGPADTSVEAGIEPLQDKLRALVPQTDAQDLLRSRALEVSGKIAEAHWLQIEMRSEGLPWPFLAVMVFWLALLFFTFGLLAPANTTVVLTLLVCSLSVAGAVFLIVDMDHPYLGYIHVTDAPLRDAIDRLGR